MEKDFTQQMNQDLAMIESALLEVFRSEERYADLQEAMEYSLLSPWRPAACAAGSRSWPCPSPAGWR